MRPITNPSYCELRDAPPLVSAIFAGRFHNVGRDRVAAMLESGDFPVPVVRTGAARMVTKTALLHSLAISPADLLVLADMEEQAGVRGRCAS